MIKTTTPSNYLATVVKLDKHRKHGNADKLICWNIMYNNVITDLTYTEGEMCIYFPVECAINKEFLAHLNLFETKELNNCKDLKGFFNKHGRVRAISLRGERSQGFLINAGLLSEYLGIYVDWNEYEGIEFDTIKDTIICKKYIPFSSKKGNNPLQKKVQKTNIIDGQFKFHINTQPLAKHLQELPLDSKATVTRKLHGTSAVFSKLLVRRKLNFIEQILATLFIKIDTTNYDSVFSSRKVIKSNIKNDTGGFYKEDIWGQWNEKLKDKIENGISLYGEIVGYTAKGANIQKRYHYGCNPEESEFYVYRITSTNYDGISYEFSFDQMVEYCNKFGLKTVPILEAFKLRDRLVGNTIDEVFLDLNKKYASNLCVMNNLEVPEEGYCIKFDNLYEPIIYKSKNPDFLELESKLLDSEEVSIEDEN